MSCILKTIVFIPRIVKEKRYVPHTYTTSGHASTSQFNPDYLGVFKIGLGPYLLLWASFGVQVGSIRTTPFLLTWSDSKKVDSYR